MPVMISATIVGGWYGARLWDLEKAPLFVDQWISLRGVMGAGSWCCGQRELFAGLFRVCRRGMVAEGGEEGLEERRLVTFDSEDRGRRWCCPTKIDGCINQMIFFWIGSL